MRKLWEFLKTEWITLTIPAVGLLIAGVIKYTYFS